MSEEILESLTFPYLTSFLRSKYKLLPSILNLSKTGNSILDSLQQHCMDTSASWTVLQGTLAISALSATTSGVLGILRGQEHYGFLAGAAALNSGVTAAAFFSLREYVVSPIFIHTLPFEQYQRRRRELGIGHEPTETRSTTSSINPTPEFSFIRSHKVLDSAVSGTVTGGLLRALKCRVPSNLVAELKAKYFDQAGPRAALPGAITVGTICTLLQLGYNEGGIQRLKFISRRQTLEAGSRPTVLPQAGVNLGATEDATEQPSSWKEKFLSLLGVQKISEEEYLERLKLQREHHLMRIKALEQKLEEEWRAKGDGE